MIIENFHKVSKQLGILVEDKNLAKYAIYAEPYSYPNAKHGYFNKRLLKFIPNNSVNDYPKEEFICYIDDVKTARLIAPEQGFNPNNITWEQYHKFVDRFYRENFTS